jgi:hypothetical protein
MIDKIDAFGCNVSLRFQDRIKNTTIFGCIITIMIYILTIAGIAWYGDDIV